jgi:DNA-binding XRE family transcriptional regulator
MTAPDAAAELQQEIERTRERLGETVEELAAKADVKAQARKKAIEVKGKAIELSERMKQSQMVRRWPLALAAAGVLTMGAAVIWRWRT